MHHTHPTNVRGTTYFCTTEHIVIPNEFIHTTHMSAHCSFFFIFTTLSKAKILGLGDTHVPTLLPHDMTRHQLHHKLGEG